MSSDWAAYARTLKEMTSAEATARRDQDAEAARNALKAREAQAAIAKADAARAATATRLADLDRTLLAAVKEVRLSPKGTVTEFTAVTVDPPRSLTEVEEAADLVAAEAERIRAKLVELRGTRAASRQRVLSSLAVLGVLIGIPVAAAVALYFQGPLWPEVGWGTVLVVVMMWLARRRHSARLWAQAVFGVMMGVLVLGAAQGLGPWPTLGAYAVLTIGLYLLYGRRKKTKKK